MPWDLNGARDADTICPRRRADEGRCHEFWDWWLDYKMSKPGYGPSTYSTTYRPKPSRTPTMTTRTCRRCSVRCTDPGARREASPSLKPKIRTTSSPIRPVTLRTSSSTPRAQAHVRALQRRHQPLLTVADADECTARGPRPHRGRVRRVRDRVENSVNNGNGTLNFGTFSFNNADGLHIVNEANSIPVAMQPYVLDDLGTIEVWYNENRNVNESATRSTTSATLKSMPATPSPTKTSTDPGGLLDGVGSGARAPPRAPAWTTTRSATRHC